MERYSSVAKIVYVSSIGFHYSILKYWSNITQQVHHKIKIGWIRILYGLDWIGLDWIK